MDSLMLLHILYKTDIMKYKSVLIKTVHSGDLSNYNRSEINNQTTSLGADIAKSAENKLPVILNWRFRLSNNDPKTYSFIINHYLLIEFENSPNEFNELAELIDNSFRAYINELLLKVENTPLPSEMYGIVYNKKIKENKANEILAIARKEQLLP